MLSEKQKHDLFTPIAKAKTTISLMETATLEEIRGEYLKVLSKSIKELEAQIEDLLDLNKSK